MEYGYIYILINASLMGMIKIGSTVISAQERARQISANTGVPTPYMVAYKLYVSDYKRFEKKVHKHLADFRVNPNREFFNYPLHMAIKLIEDYTNQSSSIDQDRYEAMEILPQLHKKYSDNIAPTISSIRIYQTNERVMLEFTKDEYVAKYLKDQYIRRIDLGFIIEDININKKMFNEYSPVSTNVEKFLELDDYSINMCIGEIFTDDGYSKL
jgi:hypothetical protein